MATKAEQFRANEQKSGAKGKKPKRRSTRKPKKAAWKRESHHAETKATHAIEERPSTGKRPSRVSSRGSANRAKGDASFERREEGKGTSSDAQYRKAKARSSRVRGH
jgi:hypothetical protein